jgi:hypothetical protein
VALVENFAGAANATVIDPTMYDYCSGQCTLVQVPTSTIEDLYHQKEEEKLEVV